MFAGTSVHAENSITISQPDGGTVTIQQEGKNNTSSIVQGSEDKNEKKNIKNSAIIIQKGEHNAAHTTQSGSENTIINVVKGQNNDIKNTQSGESSSQTIYDVNKHSVTHIHPQNGEKHD